MRIFPFSSSSRIKYYGNRETKKRREFSFDANHDVNFILYSSVCYSSSRSNANCLYVSMQRYPTVYYSVRGVSFVWFRALHTHLSSSCWNSTDFSSKLVFLYIYIYITFIAQENIYCIRIFWINKEFLLQKWFWQKYLSKIFSVGFTFLTLQFIIKFKLLKRATSKLVIRSYLISRRDGSQNIRYVTAYSRT